MSEYKRLTLTLPEDAPAGAVRAIFSTFNVRDKQGDVVKKIAMEHLDGTEVPFIWSHQWDSLPVGKGVIRVERDRALLDGAFHLQTEASRDAYNVTKIMGDLQEYSYGFDIAPDGAHLDETDEGPTRIITKIKRIYEISGVLVGAGERTGTLAIKGLTEELSDLKRGARLSAASLARIQAAIEALQALVDGERAAAADDDGDKAAAPDDEKPLPNFHACRLRDPGAFQDGTFRQMTRDHNGKEYRVIMGRLKGESTMTEQALRYAKDTWTAAEAGAHCRGHDGTFEAARATESALDAPTPTPAERMASLCVTLRDFQDWLAALPLAGDAVEHEWAASVEHRAAALQQVLTDRKARRRLTAYLAPFTPPTPSGAR